MSAWRCVAGVTVVGALLFGCGSEQVSCDCAPAPRGCVYTGRASCPCAAMVCSDVGPLGDQGSAVTDVVIIDAGVTDVGATDVGVMDVAVDRATPRDVAPPDVHPPDVPRRDVPAEDVVASCDLSAAALDRTCANDSQCRVGIFTANCCGTAQAIGYNVVSGAGFDLLRGTCERLFGGVRMCGCPTMPTLLDDGTRSFDHDRIVASCESGLCTSHLGP